MISEVSLSTVLVAYKWEVSQKSIALLNGNTGIGNKILGEFLGGVMALGFWGVR